MNTIDPQAVGIRPVESLTRPVAAGDIAGELELLLGESAALQRTAGRTMRESLRNERQRLRKRALAKLRQASDWKLAQACSNAASAIGKACATYFGGEGARVFSEAGDQVMREISPFKLRADKLEMRAEKLKLRAEQQAERAQDLEAELAGVRDLERRLLSRLDALRRSEHQLNRTAIGR